MSVSDKAATRNKKTAKVSIISTDYAHPTSDRHGINTDTWINHPLMPKDDFLYMQEPEAYFAKHNQNKAVFVAPRTQATQNATVKKKNKGKKPSKQNSDKK